MADGKGEQESHDSLLAQALIDELSCSESQAREKDVGGHVMQGLYHQAY